MKRTELFLVYVVTSYYDRMYPNRKRLWRTIRTTTSFARQIRFASSEIARELYICTIFRSGAIYVAVVTPFTLGTTICIRIRQHAFLLLLARLGAIWRQGTIMWPMHQRLQSIYTLVLIPGILFVLKCSAQETGKSLT